MLIMVVCVSKQARPKDGSCPLTIRENIAYIMGQGPWSKGEECGDNTFNTAYTDYHGDTRHEQLAWQRVSILHLLNIKGFFLVSLSRESFQLVSLNRPSEYWNLIPKTIMQNWDVIITLNSDHDMSPQTRNLHQDNGDHGSNAVRHEAVTLSWSLHRVWQHWHWRPNIRITLRQCLQRHLRRTNTSTWDPMP